MKVVGVHHPNKGGGNRRFETMLCVPGEVIELRPEPKNKHDSHAVAVYSAREVQIGYLTAERAPWIGGIIRSGREVFAIFQHDAPYGAVIRVGIDGERPDISNLPPPPSREPEPDFWPDEMPPDDV
ncbi:HIRAN domain-containing protein [Sphingobium sp.]|uniref:HIRAN domain-containing protein n=1 Tax=Sphingobium sp. TaxID=1912891 RepID=UPI003BB63411